MNLKILFKGVGILMAAQVISILAIFSINTFLAREMGPELYVVFGLILSITGFFSIILNFGFFSTISVLIGEESNKNIIREYLGAILIIFSVICILAILLIYFCSGYLNTFFNVDIAYIFYSLWFLVIFFPTRELSIQISKGLGSAILISIIRVLIPTLFFTFLLLFYFFKELDLYYVSLGQFLAITIVFVIFLIITKPKIINTKMRLKSISKKNKSYGSKIYFSSISANTWPELLVFLIPIYGIIADVAFYKIALLIISPLMLIGQNLALFLFKNFVGKTQLDFRIFFGNLVAAFFIAISFLFVAELIINLFFGKEYYQVVMLSKIMILGAMINSIYQIPDTYMNANSNGNEVLFSSIIMGLTALASASFLMPIYGIIGAAYAFVLANFAYLVSILFFYRQVVLRKQRIL